MSEADLKAGVAHGTHDLRSFNRLWAARAISDLGTSVMAIPVILYAVRVSGSSWGGGLASGTEMAAAFCFGLYGGVLGDRFNRKKLLLSTLVALAASSFGVALIVAHGSAKSPAMFTALLVMALLAGACSGVFRPIHRASWRSVVQQQAIPDLIAKIQGTSALMVLIGPPVGGLLYTVHPMTPFLLDGASFLVAAGLVGSATLPSRPARQSGETRMWADLRGGFAFVVGNRPLLDINVVSALQSLAGTGFFTALVLYVDRTGASPFVTSLLQAAAAAGVIIGAVAAPALLRRVPVGSLACLLSALGTAAFLLVTLTASKSFVAALVPIATLFVPILVAAYGGYEALVTPDHLQARVTSVGDFMSEGLSPAAPVLGGALVSLMGGTQALLVFCALFALGALLTVASKQLRSLPLAHTVDEIESEA